MLTPSVTKAVELSRADATVLEIIEAIAKSRPGYQVEVRNGIVHIAPSGLVPRAQDFLDLKVSDFRVRNEAEEIADWRLQEIAKATVSPPKLLPGGTTQAMAFSIGAEAGVPNVTLSLRDVTVDDVLDSLNTCKQPQQGIDCLLVTASRRSSGTVFPGRGLGEQADGSRTGSQGHRYFGVYGRRRG